MRTPEQINRELDRRFAELEREANTPQRRKPCEMCRHSKATGAYGPKLVCANPLVLGFDSQDAYPVSHNFGPELCGPERALWSQRTRRQRLADWWKRHEDVCMPILCFVLPVLFVWLLAHFIL